MDIFTIFDVMIKIATSIQSFVKYFNKLICYVIFANLDSI